MMRHGFPHLQKQVKVPEGRKLESPTPHMPCKKNIPSFGYSNSLLMNHKPWSVKIVIGVDCFPNLAGAYPGPLLFSHMPVSILPALGWCSTQPSSWNAIYSPCPLVISYMENQCLIGKNHHVCISFYIFLSSIHGQRSMALLNNS